MLFPTRRLRRGLRTAKAEFKNAVGADLPQGEIAAKAKRYCELLTAYRCHLLAEIVSPAEMRKVREVATKHGPQMATSQQMRGRNAA